MAGGTKLGCDGETVLSRKHNVQDDDVALPGRPEDDAERGLAVGRDRRLVSFGFEVEPKTVSDVLFVFNDEDTAQR